MQRGTKYDPWIHADAIQVRVEMAKLTAGRKGEYRWDEHLIILRPGMSTCQERCTLAHEIQHALAGDKGNVFGPIHRKQELLADRRAAHMLITPLEYARAEHIHGPHAGALAHELNVTVHMIQAWVTRQLARVAA